MVRTLSFSIIAIKLTVFIVTELILRNGLWNMWLDGTLPQWLVASGLTGLVIAAYITFFLVEPVINAAALMTRWEHFVDRRY